jgi:hypothetical protein
MESLTTKEQIKEIEKTGPYYCGAYYFPEFVRKILSLNFNLACKLHDRLYKYKSFNGKPITRKRADEIFYIYMQRLSGENKVLNFKARIYYYGVKYFGKKSWNKDGKRSN